jgi:hypothetical protein
MKGAVKLALFLAVAYALVKLAGHVDYHRYLPGGGAPKLAVVSVECIPGGMSRAEVQVRNMGDAPIESAVGTVRFGDAKQTGHFVPASIAPEGHATLVVYPHVGDASDCELVSVVDKDGRTTELARRPRFTNPRDRVQVFP